MKRIAAIVFVLLAAALMTFEAHWRMEHTLISHSDSPGGTQIAEVRSLSEGSEFAPYGQGVFLRSRRTLLYSAQSDLAFAAYCRHISLNWLSERDLRISCELTEGRAHIVRAVVNGTSVQASVNDARAAPNPALERTPIGVAVPNGRSHGAAQLER